MYVCLVFLTDFVVMCVDCIKICHPKWIILTLWGCTPLSCLADSSGSSKVRMQSSSYVKATFFLSCTNLFHLFFYSAPILSIMLGHPCICIFVFISSSPSLSSCLHLSSFIFTIKSLTLILLHFPLPANILSCIIISVHSFSSCWIYLRCFWRQQTTYIDIWTARSQLRTDSTHDSIGIKTYFCVSCDMFWFLLFSKFLAAGYIWDVFEDNRLRIIYV